MTPVNYLFGFDGRINRAKWWLFLILFLVYVAVVQYFVLPMRINFVVWLIVMAPAWYIAMAVGTKRLHDRNRAFPWAVLLVGVPLLIWLYLEYTTWASMQADILSEQARTTDEMLAAQQAIQQARQGMAARLGSLLWVLWGVQFAMFVWAVIELGLLKGTTGQNPYGPDPLANVQH